MNELKLNFPLIKLFILHILIIVVSNYAVQIPVDVFGFHATIGAFTFPLVFITTDLTVRIYGPKKARKVIFKAMIPALILSYIVGAIFEQGQFQGFAALGTFSIFVFRIAAASFGAYVIGQVTDIFVFSKLRQLPLWFVAPIASSILGNLLDTFAFFSIAFYKSTDPFMAAHWVEIAWFDYGVKLASCLAILVPLYGILLALIAKFILKRPMNSLGIA